MTGAGDGMEAQLAELHTRVSQLERHLVHLTTWLLAAVLLVLALVVLVAVTS